MNIKHNGNRVEIGCDELGYTHLCFQDEYVEPYTFTNEQLISARSAGVITEDEFNSLYVEVK